MIRAVNVVGEGAASNEVNAMPVGPPTTPQNLGATPGDGQATLIWDPPTSHGGSPITNYRIYSGTSSGGETFLMEIGDVGTYMDTGLVNGQTYYYRVSAVNAVGEGAFSEEREVTPATVPDAPSNIVAVSGNSYVNLTWNAPGFDGGSPIINYTIYRDTTSGGQSWLADVGRVFHFSDTNVTNGVTLYYRISAWNSVWEGALSADVSATPINELPTCGISSPLSGNKISGTVEVIGYASDTDGSLDSIQIRIDDGDWILVSGTEVWTVDWDTTEVSNGQHTIYARSFDGEDYSLEASVSVKTNNGGESILEEPLFWGLIVVLIIIAIVAFVLLSRRRKGEELESGEDVVEEDGT
jgi:hypothetical protein